jgi:signal peptidase I
VTKSSQLPASRGRRLWKNWLQPFLVCLLVIAPFRSAVADWNDVPTGSMKPTVLVGDRVFVNRLAYDLKVPFTNWHVAEWGGPARGDVVVLTSPADGKLLLKRVVGVPGDVVALESSRLIVNGKSRRVAAVPPKAVPQIPAAQRGRHVFNSERLSATDPGHVIMLTPGRSSSRNFGPVAVPQGRYLVMGDNRDNSFDSRGFGFVPRENILGRVNGVVFSFAPEPRWERFFTRLE